ncbi:MAG: hypothetical protein ABGX20_14785 [Bacillus sp. (in: firmicutes)]|jgi:hypothetical protein|uniref:hypothetical protein n=1 Tax=Bacillus sp. SORGH_AS_0510 TaxID=3041771 RepID=UPI002785566D|nr:hypothetical protein [Bacillus sp. SORGH_AS_0510]MDQ1144086.1 quinol-cytochrome oxidoreductase complex cytochrome b subunit [Bacillus sp. SORGH_AS_0510]
MIWIYILTPVFLLVGIALYFDRKSGSTPPDESYKAKMEEYPPEHGMNSHGPTL